MKRSCSLCLILFTCILMLLFGSAVPSVHADDPAPRIPDASDNYCAPDFPCDPSIPPARRFEMAGSAAAVMDGSVRPTESNTPASAESWGDILYSSAAVPFAWMDATIGTNTGMTGRSYNQITAPIALPFPFKFYENTYDSVKIAASGFLTFANSDSAPWQGHLPDPYAPNNLLAPYWAPFQLGGKGNVGKVFYATGGTAPNRYFVVQWNKVKGGPSTDTVGGDDEFTFEVILYEDHSIVFQYSKMTYTDRYYCGVAGIEDSYGLLGVNNVKYCKTAPSHKAVKLTRPAPAARLRLDPKFPGAFNPPGALAEFVVTLRNTGDLGPDTYNFDPYGTVPSFYAADGATLLTDTDADGRIDSGVLGEGETRTIVVKYQLGNYQSLYERINVQFEIYSVKGFYRGVMLPSVYIPDFAQAFRDNDNGAMTLDLIRNSTQQLVKVTPDNYNGSFVGLLNQPNGNYLYAWNKDRCVNAGCSIVAREIEYTLLDANGGSLHPIQKLEELGAPRKSTYDYSYGMAATSNNITGIAYIKEVDAPNGTWQQNVWFARVDASGNVIGAPRNLTKNKLWGNSTTADVPFFHNARVAATLDNRFVIVWQREILASGAWTNDIYFQIVDEAGNPVKGATNFTNAASGDGYYSPSVLGLADGNVLLAFTGSSNLGKHDAFLGVISGSGKKIRSLTNLTNDGTRYDWYYMDTLQLNNGHILLAWNAYPGHNPVGKVHVRRLELDSNLANVAGPIMPEDPYSLSGAGPVSIASDGNGHAMITWHEAHPNLRYALYLSLAEPVAFQYSHSYISTGFGGMGNAK